MNLFLILIYGFLLGYVQPAQAFGSITCYCRCMENRGTAEACWQLCGFQGTAVRLSSCGIWK